MLAARGRVPVAATPSRRRGASWTSRTAIDPSPTAEATRLTEPLRASPTAKTPGAARLERQAGPAGAAVGSVGDVGAGEDEAGAIQLDRPPQPFGAGVGADEDEEPARVEAAVGAVAAVDHGQPVELAVAVQLDDLGLREQLDAVVARDLVDQVAGHRRARSGLRTISETRREASARKRAAWPAEFPPPTIATALPAHIRASASVAA